MKSILPRTVFPTSAIGRTVVVLLVGLTLSHSLSHWIDSGNPYRSALAMSPEETAAFVIRVAAAIEVAPTSQRATVAAALSRPLVLVTWTAAYAGAALRHDHPVLTGFPPEFRRRVTVHDLTTTDTFRTLIRQFLTGLPEGRPVAVEYRLSDETLLSLRMLLVEPPSVWSLRTVAANAVMIGSIAAMALWVSGWITKPLRRLQIAADHLADNLDAPAIDECGPAEVRAAARSFNKMQAKLQAFVTARTYMLAGFSHDLRTPLTRLRFRAEDIAGPMREFIKRDLDEMQQMVSECLEYARGGSFAGQSSIYDLGILVETVCNDLLDAGHPVEVTLDSPVLARGRPQLMRRAFTNLVENAIQYGFRASVSIKTFSAEVEIKIEDQGPGIPPEFQELALAPFGRLDPSRSRTTGGTGIGLTLAHAIIKEEGGALILGNGASGGLVQIIRLPLVRLHCS